MSAPVHPDLSWPRVLKLGLVGVASDIRDRRRDRDPAGSLQPASRVPLRRRWVPRVQRPIFILGAPRSGTTFLGRCIGRLPEVSYHFEPRLTKAAARCVYDGSWSEAKAARVFRATYSALLVAGGHGGRRFAEKNPENCFIVAFLFRAFPDAHFVQIIRDGRDATVSHAEKPWLAAASAGTGRRGRGGAAWGPHARFWVEPERREEFRTVSDLERSAWCWRRFTEAALAGLADLPADRVLQIRYEEMTRRPSRAGELIADFLDVPAGAQRSALEEGLATASTSSVGRWRARLTAPEAAQVSAMCGPLLAELGYDD